MNLFALSGLSVGILCATLASIALFFGKTKLHRILLLFNIVVAIWGFGLFLVGIADNEADALFGWRFANLGGFFVGPSFFYMTSVFCNIKRTKLLYAAYAQAVIFAIIGSATGLIFNKTRVVFGLYYNEINLLYLMAVLFYLFFVILSFRELTKFLRKTYGQKRTQTLYIIFGFLPGFIGATSSFLPIFKIDLFYPFGNFGITAYCIILTYAILRHSLMDIHLVFKKTVTYSLAAGLLTGFFIVIVLAITNLFSKFAHTGSLKINIFAALVIALLFNPLKDSIQLFIDRIFYKTTYDYYAAIKKASYELATTIDLQYIQKLIADAIFSTLRVKSIYILTSEEDGFRAAYFRPAKGGIYDKSRIHEQKIDSRSGLIEAVKERKDIINKDELPFLLSQNAANKVKEELNAFGGQIAVPIFIDDRLSFLLLLGEKLSGHAFSYEDLSLLNTLANQAAVSLKNAGLYNEVKLRVAQLEEAEKEIKKSLKEKEVLLKEIHHRVKNNMQIISSLLKLQSNRTTDKKDVEFLRESYHRIRSMSLIHEKLYGSKNLSYINFNEYISDLSKNIFRSYISSAEKISFKIEADDIWLGIDASIPCGLLINELLSNSLKHAFPDGREGEIRLSIRKTGRGEIQLIVSDNGIGIPENIDFRNTDSLGLRLVTILSENQLQGKIELDRTAGTKFTITFKEIEPGERVKE